MKSRFALAILSLAASLTHAQTAWYVSPDGDDGDGKTWATAKRTIQAAIDIASAGDTITVTNGTYAPIATANLAITIHSVNGAEHTIIDGGGTNRCATLGTVVSQTNTIIKGFTLRNGQASSGGGSSSGMLYDCTLSNNTANYGGGANLGILSRCVLLGNTANNGGGGSYNGILNNCILIENKVKSTSSYYGGGGAFRGTLNNCTLVGNAAGWSGGGSYESTLNNCILWGNTNMSGVINNYYDSSFNYSCTTPLPGGIGKQPIIRKNQFL